MIVLITGANSGFGAAVARKFVAETAYWVATLPAQVNINHIEMMPTCQGYGALNIERQPAA